MAMDDIGWIEIVPSPFARRNCLTSQQLLNPSVGTPGISAPAPHQAPSLSSHTSFVTGIWVQLTVFVSVLVIRQGPLVAPFAWMFGPTCVKFVRRMLGCFGSVRYGSIDTPSTGCGTLFDTL